MKKFYLLITFLIISKGLTQVNTESYRIKSDSSGFSLISELELTLMSGNTDFQYFGSNSRINYNWNSMDNTFLIMNGGFGREDGHTFFSQALLHLRNVNALSNSFLLEMFIQYDNNESLLQKNRYLVGSGLRYRLWDKETFLSRIGASFFWELEEYNLDKEAKHERESNTLRFSSYFTLRVEFKKDITFLSVSYIQPDINDIEDLRILTNNAFNMKLSESIGLNIKMDARYDSKPADGIKKYDLSSKIGLMISFD